MSSTISYFEHIAKEIGFDPKTDFGLFRPLPDENNSSIKMPLIQSDNHGNVIYNIMNIHGEIVADDISEARSKQKYKPVQLIRKADPGDGPKYLPVRTGQGVYPFISREVADAFKLGKQVKRLILTEGYKKAFVACKKGLMCIGLPGITVWKSKDSKEIFQDIKTFVEKCQVEDILWLTDADTLNVNWEPNKDLYKRPSSFYNSVSMFKSLCRDWNVNLFYAHIHEESKLKGIDDLLIGSPDKVKYIVKELNKSSGDTTYIRRYNVSTMSYLKIQEIFGIHSDPATFYFKYEKFIGLEEFIYRNGIYQFDIESNDLKYLKCGESSQFIRIMKDYYMRASMPTTTSFVKNTLIPTDKDSIREKFKGIKKEKVNQIIHDISFYDGFFNEPGHLEFKQFIPITSADGFETRWYNKYMPLTHKPSKHNVTLDNIPLSYNFIKHIFGTKEIEYKGKIIHEYDLGFDYLKLLYLKPKQMLPILSLVSREQKTGKTIFWRWMVAIFQQNAKIIPPEMLTGNFTEYFMNSLLAIIDEALFNKRETMERVKSLTTNDSNMVNGKHTKEIEVQTYLKVGLSSNNVDDFAILTAADKRFWVIEIPVITPENQIIDFFPKLCEEIPDLLAYLIQIDYTTDKDDDRMYFAEWIRNTEALQRVIEGSKPGKEKLITETIKDYMSNSGKLEVHLGKTDIRDLSHERNLELGTITWVLETKMQKKAVGYSRHYTYYDFRIGENEFSSDTVVEQRRKTNYYTFNAIDLFKPEEIIQIYKLNQLIEAESEKIIQPTFKASITAEKFFSTYYKDKEIPCQKEDFINVYNNSGSFTELEAKLQDFIIGQSDIPF